MTNVSSGKKKSKRIFYFDALRALAILTVITLHIYNNTGSMVAEQYGVIPSINWIISCFNGSWFRFGVDLFLMLSGALSLGRVWDIKSFLGKRIPRIVMPFLFWGFVLSMLLIGISYYAPDFLCTIKSFDIMSILTYLWDSYNASNMGFTQYWFFWMILGTYLIMPIFNKWLLHSELTEVEYFLFFWLITCIFDFTIYTPFPIKLSYFSGPIGMVVLGYYLRHTERKIFNNPYVGPVITILALIINAYVFYIMFPVDGFKIDRYSIFLAFQVTGIFLLFKNFKWDEHRLTKPDGLFRKGVQSIAKYSYGFYLIHIVILKLLLTYLQPFLHYKALTFTLWILTIVFTWIVMAVCYRVPYLNQVIGAK
ncbi:acyltransferase family protein [Methanobrevibacter sp.]|uniref:acyltransferase n=1 Tax=Methanobrevibacter sp. TaxID=66852 RepID=UPI0025F8815E|nr:acyltransferase family protein [Methanobrevibacter sp.]MBQ2666052.1 acyltransferase family protein [Methanobrevibacter sp.]